MKKDVIYYTLEQMDAVQEFINKSFGDGGEGLVGHEIKSEYVHSDVAVVTAKEGSRCFATFGMGAREMNSPLAADGLGRAELMMFGSADMELTGEEALAVASELQWLSKIPFRNDTWLGPGHTVPASDNFRKTFGFDAFVLDVIAAQDFEELGKILFLAAIPIYEGEREAMMRGSSLDVVERMEEAFGDEIYYADSRREELSI